MGRRKQFEGYITAKSVTDVYYLTHRLTHNDAETRKILSKLFTLFHLLDTAFGDWQKSSTKNPAKKKRTPANMIFPPRSEEGIANCS
ncbi:MAG: hypothetical protein Q4E29_07640 [Lachnospiraceae bacterium]|nr:hypothetical protein [Lachnospiraceae bacterium]